MIYFFDTSALLKRYHLEKGSSVVIDLFENRENTLLICSFSIAETISALHRLHKRGEINGKDFDMAHFMFSWDHSSGRVGLIDILRQHILSAHDLILQYNLRPADAVIIACALDIKAHSPIFVCSDTRSGLLRSAEAEGLSTLNPLSPP